MRKVLSFVILGMVVQRRMEVVMKLVFAVVVMVIVVEAGVVMLFVFVVAMVNWLLACADNLRLAYPQMKNKRHTTE